MSHINNTYYFVYFFLSISYFKLFCIVMTGEYKTYLNVDVNQSFMQKILRLNATILTTNLAAVVCVCAKFDQFLALRAYFESIRPENFVRIAKFPYAAFGPLFAFHCPLFFTRNNDL